MSGGNIAVPQKPIGQRKRYISGGSPAIKKMRELRHDPIIELVKVHRRLLDEDKFWRETRNATIVTVQGNGKILNYSAITHAAILSQIIACNEKLLRFKYARIPENVPEAASPNSPLVIKCGDTTANVLNGEYHTTESETITKGFTDFEPLVEQPIEGYASFKDSYGGNSKARQEVVREVIDLERLKPGY
jgi:hypothetical protein